MAASDSTQAGNARSRTPAGIVILCLLLTLYSVLWFVTAAFGTGAIAAIAIPVAVSVLVLVYLLYTGSAVGWWLALVALAGSTLWRFSLVARGSADNLSNALVGLGLLAYLISKHEFYGAFSAGR
ncbi:hypothetical protein GCM10028857_17590 [Salinarchaeum chitinilyticum]